MDMIFTEEQVEGNKRAIIAISSKYGTNNSDYYNLYDALKKYTASDQYVESQNEFNILPSKKLFVPVDSSQILKDSTFQKNFPILDRINLDITSNYLYKNDLAILCMIATNNWKRPIYFTSGGDELDKLGLEPYLEIEGMCKRLVPYQTNGINKERTVAILDQKFKFGNASEPGVYFDEVNRGHLLMMRQTYALTAKYLCDEADKMGRNALITGRDYKADSARNLALAKKLVQKIDKGISDKNMPYGMTSARGTDHNNISYALMEIAQKCGENEIATRIKAQLEKDLKQQHTYYLSLGDKMSNEELLANLYAAAEGKANYLSDAQQAFARDWFSCVQLMNRLGLLK
jgi:hypothetical protein